MKIVTVVGARPQFIKASVVSRTIANQRKKGKDIKDVILHTGQHFDANMSEIFFHQMQIPKPDYNLDIHGMNHGAMTGQMLEKIEKVLLDEKPDWVIVYGDTNSTLAGALAAKKLHLKVAHVEAGLRSFNMRMPEEINRILTDRISDLLFCPTDAAVENLRNEGFVVEGEAGRGFGKILKVGDVMQDAAHFYAGLAQQPEILSNLHFPTFVLATIHRAENTDDPERLTAIFEALNAIALEMPIILPIHPRTREKLRMFDLEPKTPSLMLINPVGYLEMVYLLEHCALVMTDSGGLQKEAYFFGKPCLTMRDETEWIELVEYGGNILVGAKREKIVEAFSYVVNKGAESKEYGTDLYGDGYAGERIVRALEEA